MNEDVSLERTAVKHCSLQSHSDPRILLNKTHHRGLVPLHNACSYGHFEVTELLIQHGANVNACDLWQFTPLHEACCKGR